MEDGYVVEVIDRAAHAMARGLRRTLDLLIVELESQKYERLCAIADLRSANIHVPILVLLGPGLSRWGVDALHAGADAYLTRPFEHVELVARIDSLARRATNPAWVLGAFPIVMRDDLVVQSSGRVASLSPLQFSLLRCLVKRHGEVVSRAEIVRDAWGDGQDRDTRLVNSHLTNLRRKLTAFPFRIVTIRGVGLRIVWSSFGASSS